MRSFKYSELLCSERLDNYTLYEIHRLYFWGLVRFGTVNINSKTIYRASIVNAIRLEIYGGWSAAFYTINPSLYKSELIMRYKKPQELKEAFLEEFI